MSIPKNRSKLQTVGGCVKKNASLGVCGCLGGPQAAAHRRRTRLWRRVGLSVEHARCSPATTVHSSSLPPWPPSNLPPLTHSTSLQTGTATDRSKNLALDRQRNRIVKK
eukprot:Selendium_serpulae@DN1512_c0_g1_i3.p1